MEVLMQASFGCPVYTQSGLMKFAATYPFTIATVFATTGLFLALMGHRFFKVSIFIASMIAVVFAVTLLSFLIFERREETALWLVWLMLVLAFLIAGYPSYLLVKKEKTGTCVLCGCAGFCFGLILNEIALYKLKSFAVFWIV